MSQKMLIALATTIVALHLGQNVAGLTPSKTLLVNKTKDGAEIDRPQPRCTEDCAAKNGVCGKFGCVCRHGVDNFPHCESVCDMLDCPANDGHCVKFGTGVHECMCNNGHNNYPDCSTNESKKCQECRKMNADCVSVGMSYERINE